MPEYVRNDFVHRFSRDTTPPIRPPNGTGWKYAGPTSLRRSGTSRMPSSPIIVSDLFWGPTRPQVTLATMFSEYSIQPTLKSGAIFFTAMPLSGSWHEAKAVTLFAGPKNAASHVNTYPACSNVQPTSNSSWAGQRTPASLRHRHGASFGAIIPSSKLA